MLQYRVMGRGHSAVKGYLGEVCTCILCRGDGRGLSRVEEGGGSVAEGVCLSVHFDAIL